MKKQSKVTKRKSQRNTVSKAKKGSKVATKGATRKSPVSKKGKTAAQSVSKRAGRAEKPAPARATKAATQGNNRRPQDGLVRKSVRADQVVDRKDARAPLSNTAREAPVTNSTDDAPIPRTHLTDKQLNEFRELLLQKRAELVGDVERLTEEALNRKSDGHGDNSIMPIHMADIGSDNWEQEFTLGLIDNERSRVREIDEALQRIEDKTYGTCLATLKPITIARLRAKPWAKYGIEYARLRDEGRAP